MADESLPVAIIGAGPTGIACAVELQRQGVDSVCYDRGSILDSIAKTHNAAPSQIALAWVLKRSPIMLPTPGTSKVAHLEENVAAVDIQLSDEEFDALDHAGRKEGAS